MLKRLRDSEFSDRAEDIRGATLHGYNNEKIGTIDDIVYDTDTQTARYAIVDTGGLLTTGRFLLPSDYLRQSENDPDAFRTDLTKNQIEDLPEFDEHILGSDQRFRDYEGRYRSKLQTYNFSLPSSRHPRVTRFENRLRSISPTVGSATTANIANVSTP